MSVYEPMQGGYSYTPSWLAHFFNSFPHVDLTFQGVNSTFEPEDARYREVWILSLNVTIQYPIYNLRTPEVVLSEFIVFYSFKDVYVI